MMVAPLLRGQGGFTGPSQGVNKPLGTAGPQSYLSLIADIHDETNRHGRDLDRFLARIG
jgi:hypothetical protein